MTTKKLAYLFLFISIIIAGYFVYDTYRVVSKEKSGQGDSTNQDGQSGSSDLEIKYNEYSIDENLKYSLAEVKEDRTVLYFYNEEVTCGDKGVFKSTYPDLGLVITIEKKVQDAGSGAIKTSSLYVRDTDGSYLEITGVPNVKNYIEIEENDSQGENGSQKIKGKLNLSWENRTIKGGFEALSCGSGI